MPEPSAITALVAADDGFYVEVEGDYLVRIADASHAAVEQTAIPGQLVRQGSVVKIDLSDFGHYTLVEQSLEGESEPAELGQVAFSHQLAERTLFSPAKDGGFLLAVQMLAESSDPEKPPTASHELVLLNAAGKETARLSIPVAGGNEDSFRRVKRGADGNVYVMAFGDTGVDIGKVVLP